MARLAVAYFNSNGTWVCPAGVTNVWLIGQGGGAGGSGGRNAVDDIGIAGPGTTTYMTQVGVTPNSSYSITIGQGGAGGAPRTTQAQNGSGGGDTTFGALHTFYGAVRDATTNLNGTVLELKNGFAGFAGYEDTDCYAHSGFMISSPQNTGVKGTNSGNYKGGQGSTPGFYNGTLGLGGNANNAGTGSNGNAATGYGHGGAAGGAGSSAGGTGADGNPGQLWVVWVE